MNRRRFLKTTAAAVAATPFVSRGASNDAFEIGLVADVQYADAAAKGTRFYRQSVAKLEAAVEHFNGREQAFCVHLGDLIDHQWKNFDEIVKPLGRSRRPWHQLLGNHDFEVMDQEKPRVRTRLGMPWRYGSFEHRDIRFVVLDTNDVSVYAHATGTPERAEAEQELARVVAEKLRQAKPWNGAIGRTQLAWFDRTCSAARTARQKVIVLAHHPVLPDNEHNVWNAADVLSMVDRHPNIVAWINGHNHKGNFAERNGVPFVTMHGMVETADTTAFATAKVLADRLVLTGHGREPSREMVFRK